MSEICSEHVIESHRFPSFGAAVTVRAQSPRAPRDLRLVAAVLIWAVGFASISFLVSFAHDGLSSKAQADSWVCKRH